jgi:hypothetical protein
MRTKKIQELDYISILADVFHKKVDFIRVRAYVTSCGRRHGVDRNLLRVLEVLVRISGRMQKGASWFS